MRCRSPLVAFLLTSLVMWTATLCFSTIVDAAIRMCSLDEWATCAYNPGNSGNQPRLGHGGSVDAAESFLKCLAGATPRHCAKARQAGYCGVNRGAVQELGAVLQCLKDPALSDSTSFCRHSGSGDLTPAQECAGFFGPLLGCTVSDALCATTFDSAFTSYIPVTATSSPTAPTAGGNKTTTTEASSAEIPLAFTAADVAADPVKYVLYGNRESKATLHSAGAITQPTVYNIAAAAFILLLCVALPWAVHLYMLHVSGDGSPVEALLSIERAVARTVHVMRSGSLVEIRDLHRELRARLASSSCESAAATLSCVRALYSTYRYLCFTPDALKQYLPQQQQQWEAWIEAQKEQHQKQQQYHLQQLQQKQTSVSNSPTARRWTIEGQQDDDYWAEKEGGEKTTTTADTAEGSSIFFAESLNSIGGASRRQSGIFLTSGLSALDVQQLLNVTALSISFDVPISALAAVGSPSALDSSSASNAANESSTTSLGGVFSAMQQSATTAPMSSSTSTPRGADARSDTGSSAATDPFDVNAIVPLQPFYELVLEIVRQCVEEHDGTVEHFLGDCLLASFNNSVAVVSRFAASPSSSTSTEAAKRKQHQQLQRDGLRPHASERDRDEHFGDIEHVMHATECSTSLVRRLRAVSAPTGAVVIGMATARGAALLCGADDTSSSSSAGAATSAAAAAAARSSSRFRRCVVTGPSFRLAAGLSRLAKHFIFHPDGNRQHAAYMPRYMDRTLLNVYAFSDWCPVRCNNRVVNQFRERFLGTLVTGDNEPTLCSHFVPPASDVLPQRPQQNTLAMLPQAEALKKERDEILNAVLAIRIAQAAALHHRDQRNRQKRGRHQHTNNNNTNNNNNTSHDQRMFQQVGFGASMRASQGGGEIQENFHRGGGGGRERGDNILLAALASGRREHGGGDNKSRRTTSPSSQRTSQQHLGALLDDSNDEDEDDGGDYHRGPGRRKGGDGAADANSNCDSLLLDRVFGEDAADIAADILSPVQLQRIALEERRRKRLLQIAATDTLEAAGALESWQHLQQRLDRLGKNNKGAADREVFLHPWEQLMSEREVPLLSREFVSPFMSAAQWNESIAARNAILEAIATNIDPERRAEQGADEEDTSTNTFDDGQHHPHQHHHHHHQFIIDEDQQQPLSSASHCASPSASVSTKTQLPAVISVNTAFPGGNVNTCADSGALAGSGGSNSGCSSSENLGVGIPKMVAQTKVTITAANSFGSDCDDDDPHHTAGGGSSGDWFSVGLLMFDRTKWTAFLSNQQSVGREEREELLRAIKDATLPLYSEAL